MRPPEFTGGNDALIEPQRLERWHASMRPPEFTGGNVVNEQSIRPLVDLLQ